MPLSALVLQPSSHARDVLESAGYTVGANGVTQWLNQLLVPAGERVLVKKSNMMIDHDSRFPNRGLVFLTRAGVHQLLMASTKPAAKEFREWLAGEVVVAIEDTGGNSSNPMP